MDLTRGVYSEPEDTLLTSRALDFLAAGPADVVDLIGHICSLPKAPRIVAEHMAHAMFAGRREFLLAADGRWMLADLTAMPYTVDRVSDVPRETGNAKRHRASSRADSTEPLSSLSYVVVDTETTGGSHWSTDRITEIAAVVVRNGEIVEVFETLVNPKRPIPNFVSRLTNITWDMVKHAPTFRPDRAGGRARAGRERLRGTQRACSTGGSSARRCRAPPVDSSAGGASAPSKWRARFFHSFHVGRSITCSLLRSRESRASPRGRRCRCNRQVPDPDAPRLAGSRVRHLGRSRDAAAGAGGSPQEAPLLRVADAGSARHHRVTAPSPRVERRKIGDFTVHAIQAGGQRLDGGAMFGVVPKPLWEKRIPADERNRIQLGMRCLLIEHPSGLILIDTGAGNKEDEKFKDIYGIENEGAERQDDARGWPEGSRSGRQRTSRS